MKIHTIVLWLRQFRLLHRWIGSGMALFITITAVTGILLGWKKNFTTLQPETKNGISSNMDQWKSISAIGSAASKALDAAGIRDNPVDRFDVRPDQGIVKVLFRDGYWEVQVDGVSGEVLSVARRHSDWIEHIHDGSIFSEAFKLVYTNLLGITLLTLTCTGLFLWVAPKIVRHARNR